MRQSSASQPLRTEISKRPWVRVVALPESTITNEGFGVAEDGGCLVRWSSVVRVAIGYEIHPIAIADWDFWAFQTAAPDVTYWIYTDLASPFSADIRRRFDIGTVPPMKDWEDRDFCVCACVVWPSRDAGHPLYLTVKRHWWSWNGRLSFAAAPGPRFQR